VDEKSDGTGGGDAIVDRTWGSEFWMNAGMGRLFTELQRHERQSPDHFAAAADAVNYLVRLAYIATAVSYDPLTSVVITREDTVTANECRTTAMSEIGELRDAAAHNGDADADVNIEAIGADIRRECNQCVDAVMNFYIASSMYHI
jgi:hypothetical protein